MSEFLEGYGVADAKRERRWKWIVGSVLAVLLVGFSGWLLFRDYREERAAKQFFDLLRQKDYDNAYRMWGCDPATPCRDYSMANFMEDWGPTGVHGQIDKLKFGKKKSCDTGIIQFLEYGPDDTVNLWVERSNLTLSFAPWPVCEPRWQAPSPPQ